MDSVHEPVTAEGAIAQKRTGFGTALPALVGRVVAAGPRCCEQFKRLLGLDRCPACAVSTLAWVEHAVELAVTVPNSAPVVLRIERRSPQSQGLLQTKHLVVYGRGKLMPAAIAESVGRHAGERLGSSTLEDLGALIAADPDCGRPGLAVPPTVNDQSRPRSLLDTWGATDSYADFFAGGEMARSQLDSIDPTKLFQFVQHCDNECHYVMPHSVGSVVSLVSYPWDNRSREPMRPFDQGLANLSDAQFVEEGMVTTDLDEDDVIFGNPAKLAGLLAYVTSRPNPRHKLIFFSNTCVPTVVGEDVESMVKRARAKGQRPILYLTVTPRSMSNVFQSLLVQRRLQAEQKGLPVRARSINLVGFGRGRARDELEQLLAQAELSTNVRLLPELAPELVDELPRASLNVFCPNRLWQHLYDQLVADTRMEHVMPPAPYGWQGTRRWLLHVSEAMHMEPATAAAAFEMHAARWAQRWHELQQQARDYRLGLVVRDQEAYYLTSPDATWGIPLLSLLEEMGFGLEVLVAVSEPSLAASAARSIRACLSQPGRHFIRAFDSFAFLRARLRDSPAHAFVSYHTFDWRLTESGKSIVSLAQFEPGVGGAVRTLERLVGICRTPFYRRYAKYLRRSAQGLRLDGSGGDHG